MNEEKAKTRKQNEEEKIKKLSNEAALGGRPKPKCRHIGIGRPHLSVEVCLPHLSVSV
jgi:hypothetical protein